MIQVCFYLWCVFETAMVIVSANDLLDILPRKAVRSPAGQVVVSKESLVETIQHVIALKPAEQPLRATAFPELQVHLKVAKLVGANHEFFSLEVMRHALQGFQFFLNADEWTKVQSHLVNLASSGELIVREINDQKILETVESRSCLGPSQETRTKIKRERSRAGSESLDAATNSGDAPATEHETSSSASGRPGRKRSIESETNLDDYQRQYCSYSWMDLLREIANKDAKLVKVEQEKDIQALQISQLRKKTKSLQQKTRRAQSTVDRQKQKLSNKTGAAIKPCEASLAGPQTIEQRLAIRRTGKFGDGRYLTLPSRISLAIRRNFSNVACGDLSLILLDDASRFTVAKSEVQSGAALVAASQSFHRHMLEDFSSGEPSLSIHVISQDATNSNVLQKQKLCAMILHSSFLYRPSSSIESEGKGSDSFVWTWDLFQSWQGVADVQFVRDGSGAGSVGLTTKMLESLGSPTIKSLVDEYQSRRTSGNLSHTTQLLACNL